MPRTLTAPGPLDTLEEAFDLLQRAPAAVWLRYLAGAAPLLVGLLFTWNDFSGSGGETDNPVVAAVLLVALLVWFYRCRQMFAGQLRLMLSLGVEKAARPAWSAACFEGTKLLAIPIAALSLLPLAYATAFYRSLTLFAGEGLTAREAFAKAWKAALPWQRENWLVLAILNLLAIAAFVDIAITVIVAPMLVKIFTGYESIFTQRGAAILSFQMPLILGLTWVCFDPLLQAVYTVRAFQWEGLRTGEDLLVRLKKLAPVIAVVAVIAMVPCCRAEATLSRDGLNQSIDKTLESRDYNWRVPLPEDTEKKDWFIDSVDRLLALVEKGWKAITDAVSDFFDWLDHMLRNKMSYSERMQSGKPSAVRPIFYVLGLAVVAIAGILIWKFGVRRKTALPVVSAGSPLVDLTDEALLASDLPEDEWLKMAERYANSGDLRLALRALYLGTLALLSRRGLVTIHACKSNRDYEGELRRRSRDMGLTQVFHRNIRSFEQAWYGFHEVTGEQVRDFRENLGRMRSDAA